ncbi:solute carrier family 23 member 3-like isoform 2-T2 [Alca torda]
MNGGHRGAPGARSPVLASCFPQKMCSWVLSCCFALQVSGAVLVSGLVQLVLGVSGVCGWAAQRCGPMVLAPSLSIIGLSAYKEAAFFCSTNWGIALLLMLLVVTFSQHLGSCRLPFCTWPQAQRGSMEPSVPTLRTFSVLLPFASVCIVCAILSRFRIPWESLDLAMAQLSWANSTFHAPWLRIPYAGEWRWPLLTPRVLAVGIAMAIGCSMNSMGCYVLCGRLLRAPRLPPHACNRGLCMEGLGSLLAGLLGTPGGTAASIANACAIGFTQVCPGWGEEGRQGMGRQWSRRCGGPVAPRLSLSQHWEGGSVWHRVEVTLLILIFPSFFLPDWLSLLSTNKRSGVCGAGHVPKAGRAPHPHPAGHSWWVPCPCPALHCPQPAWWCLTPAFTGGVLCITYAVAVGTGISYFQYADIDSGRNIFIVGFAMFMALLVPRWLGAAPAHLATGWVPLDLLFLSLLMVPVFLTGLLSFFMENTVSGSLEERGLLSDLLLRKAGPGARRPCGETDEASQVYGLPAGLRRLLPSSCKAFPCCFLCPGSEEEEEEEEESSCAPEEGTAAPGEGTQLLLRPGSGEPQPPRRPSEMEMSTWRSEA